MNNVNAKRIISFALAVVMTVMTTISVSAASNELPYGTSMTYDSTTGEVIYGLDQKYSSIEDGAIYSNSENADVAQTNATSASWGTIDNTTDSPYRNICWVKSTFSDGTVKYGSGTLVYFDVMLTSGEMVYSHDNGGWATQVEVAPGKNGSSNPLGVAYKTSMTTNNAWVNNKDINWNWGIVDLNKSFSTYQLYGYYSSYTEYLNKNVVSYGYPNNSMQFYSNSFVIDASSNTLQHFCKISANGGAVIDSATGNLVGINTVTSIQSSGNGTFVKAITAVRINSDLYGRLRAHCGLS